MIKHYKKYVMITLVAALLGTVISGCRSNVEYIEENLKNDNYVKAVKKAVEREADCIVCMDDYICSIANTELRRIGKKIPDNIKIATCYDSPTTVNSMPPITGIKFDTRKLGEKAAQTILELLGIDIGNDSDYHEEEISGNVFKDREIQKQDLTIGYEIVERASTM